MLVLIITLFAALLPSTMMQAPHRLELAARAADTLVVDHDELMEKEEGYRSLVKQGVPQKRVVGIIAAASLGFSILKGIAANVDFSRTCVIGLANKGNKRLINPTWYMHHGNIRAPLPRIIEPHDAAIFTFEKTHYAPFGTSGMLTYTIEGTNIQVAALWDVPFFYGIESNWFNIKLYHNAQSTESWYNKIHGKSEGPLKVWDRGHWLTMTLNNAKVHGAMTNNAKASFLIELEY